MLSIKDKSFSLQQKVLTQLRSIFRAAEENRLIEKSPVSSTIKPSGEKTSEKIPLIPTQVRQLLARVTEDEARTFVMLALFTGMRRGEILGLYWSDIDFQEHIIHVRHSAELANKSSVVTDQLKTSASRREIPMPEALEAWLKEYRDFRRQGLVLSMKGGKPYTRGAYEAMWRTIAKKLPDVSFSAHILRHTYITHLFEAGLDMKEIQYLAGHSTIDMTLRVYTHYDRVTRQEKTFEKVRESIGTNDIEKSDK